MLTRFSFDCEESKIPNRYVRESVLDSNRYCAVGLLERLAFFELMLNADDWGLVPVHQVFLQRKTTVFAGLSSEAVGAKLLTLEQADLIRCYTVGSNPFAYIPRNGFFIRSKRPKYPLPDFTQPQNRSRFKELAEICNARALHQISTTTSTITTSTSTTTKHKTPDAVQTREKPAEASNLELAVLEAPTALPDCPAEAIVAAFHKILPEAARIVNLTPARRVSLRARWKEFALLRGYSTRAAGIAEWEKLFAYCRESAFLMGKIKPAPGRSTPFELTLDFLIQPAKFTDTIEGRYHRGS